MSKAKADTIAPEHRTESPAVVAHTYLRLRGEQRGEITVYHAKTATARVTVTLGSILQTFWSANAAQGVLEGLSAAKHTLIFMPADIGPASHDPYDQPTIAVEWTRRPQYAVLPRTRLTDDRRTTLRWTDVCMGPLTFQILDRAAFHSIVDLLGDAHRTTAAVCLDGHRHRADPTRDDYRPAHETGR